MSDSNGLNSAEVDRLFPVPLYRAVLDTDLDALRARILEISQGRQLKRNHVINVDSSHGVYGLRRDRFFAPLLEQFLDHSRSFLGKLGYDKYFQDECFIGSAWFNISRKDDNLGKHIHPGAILSGAFYVESNPSDEIFFFRDDDMIIPPTKATEFSQKIAGYSCDPGRLLIFKSNLNHNTNIKENGQKIVISFNVNKKTQ